MVDHKPESSSGSPLISVITPSYNSAEYISEAIESVQSQSYSNSEHIIIDSNSTDETVDILENSESIRYISESDDGIYDALNKGLELADGDLIGWLNADDKYAKGAFQSFAVAYNQNPSCDLIAGNCSVFTENDGQETQINTLEFTDEKSFNNSEIKHKATLLNGCMFSPDLFRRIGYFDTKLQIGGDREFLIRIAASRPQIARVDDMVYKYRKHDESLTFGEGFYHSRAWRQMNEDSMKYLPKYLSDDSISDELAEYCRSIFRYRATKLLEYYILNHEWKKTVGVIQLILQRDILWSLWVMRKATTRVYGKLRSK